MKKAIIGILALVIISFSAWKDNIGSIVQDRNDRPVIKIGVVLPLSGNMADIGIAGKQALNMSFNKWKNQNTKYKYDLLIEDDFFEAKRVSLIINKFVHVDNVRAVLSMFANGANIISPIANNTGTIHVTCAWGSQSAIGFYNFNNHTQYEENARVFLAALKERNITSISLFTQNNISSLQNTKVLTDVLKGGGITIFANETFNPGIRDFTIMIQKALMLGNPDIFYVNGMNPDTFIFAKNLKMLTGELKLTTIGDFTKYSDKTPFNDLWFAEPAYGTDDFISEFTKINKDEPLSCTGNIYDNLDILIWAFENTVLRSGEVIPHNDDVVKTLHSIKNWQGVIGNISVDEAGIIQSEASIKMIKDGKAILVER